MDLFDKMATYVRVVEAGKLAAAARQLRISSAAVSRQIAALERELGATLLLRSTRRLVVTPVGRAYFERCQRILREVDDAQVVARGTALDGGLVINAPVSFGLAWVVPRVRSFVTAHPEMQLDLRIEDRIVDLALEGVDLAIRVGTPPPQSTEVVAHRLHEFRRIVVAAPSYLVRRGTPTTAEALADHDAISHPVDAPLWPGTRHSRARIRVAFRSNALQAILSLAIDGLGVALLPDWFVAPSLASRELVRLLPTWRSAALHVHALHRRSLRGEARVRALIAHLRDSTGAG